MGPEILLEGRIERDVALIVGHVELHLGMREARPVAGEVSSNRRGSGSSRRFSGLPPRKSRQRYDRRLIVKRFRCWDGRPQGTTAICAHWTAGVDVKPTLRFAAADAAATGIADIYAAASIPLRGDGVPNDD